MSSIRQRSLTSASTANAAGTSSRGPTMLGTLSSWLRPEEAARHFGQLRRPAMVYLRPAGHPAPVRPSRPAPRPDESRYGPARLPRDHGWPLHRTSRDRSPTGGEDMARRLLERRRATARRGSSDAAAPGTP